MVRAIDIVERALALYGAPVYVRHEIVHNKFVVDDLKSKGAVFVKELDEIPDGDRPVVFSAHGVPKSVPAAATARHLFQIDATCPLVTKVHMEAQRHHAEGLDIILIGHKGHPEVIGTMGQLPQGAVTLIDTVADAEALQVRDPAKLAFVTQTTLSVDDTKDVIAVLQRRFPLIKGPFKEDICYATTNRQEAVKADCQPHRLAAGGGGAQFLELEAAGRGRRQEWLPARSSGAARQRTSTGRTCRASAPSASRPGLQRPNCWSTR